MKVEMIGETWVQLCCGNCTRVTPEAIAILEVCSGKDYWLLMFEALVLMR
jgi:hypothetical protein